MAEFRIRVVVDPSNASRGTRQVERELNRVGNSATRVQRLIARAFAFTSISLGVTSAIRTLANFEQQMSTVRAITGATETQFRALRLEATRLGITTRFSASEAAEGMQFLARAGFEVDEVLASINDTLLLAQAGALSLGAAADIASNILTGFRLSAAEAGRVVDVLALAANSANTNVQQLGDAMKFVAPVAAGLGVSLEEAAAAISTLSDAGLQGSLAGTGLRRVLAELESPASKTVKILRTLGLTANDVRISQVGLTRALENLRKAGVDTGLALEIFGDRGGPAFEVMSTAIPRIKELTEALEDSGGTAERIARIMDNNLNGALLAVRSAIEGLVLALGDAGATGVLTTLFGLIAEGLRFIATNIDVVVRAIEVLAVVIATRFIVSLFSATGAIGAHIVAHVRYQLALGASSTITAVFAAAVTAAQRTVVGLTVAIAANPIGFLIAALTTVISLLFIFGDKITVTTDGLVTLKDVGVAAFQLIMEAVTPVLNVLEQGFITALNFVGIKVESFGATVKAVFNAILLVIKTRINILVALWVGAFNAIVAVWGNLPAVFKDIGIQAVNGLVSLVIDGVQALADVLNNLPGVDIKIDKTLKDLLLLENTAAGAARGTANVVAGAFKDAFNRDFVGDGINAVFDRAREIAETRRAETPAETRTSPATLSGSIPLIPGAGANIDLGEGGSLDRLEKRVQLMDRLQRQLQNERDLLGLTNEQRGVENSLLGIKEQFIKNQTPLTEAETAAIRAQIEALQDMEQALILINDVAETVFSSIEDSLVAFIKTGEFNFKDFATNIIADLARIALRAFILKPILAGLGSFLGGSFLGGFQSTSPNLGSLGGFQNGGSIIAGGTGGPDSQLFVSRVSPGERIDFTPAGQQSSGGGGGTTINFNISTPDADSFRKSQSQLAATATRLISRGRRNM